MVMREVSELLTHEVSDPRLSMVSISGVRMNSDVSVAEVMYTCAGDEEKLAQVAEGLEKAKGFIRKKLAGRLRTRHVPELRFMRDEFLEDVVYGGFQGSDPPDN